MQTSFCGTEQAEGLPGCLARHKVYFMSEPGCDSCRFPGHDPGLHADNCPESFTSMPGIHHRDAAHAGTCRFRMSADVK